MRKSKKSAPDVLKMIRDRHEQRIQQNHEASLGLASDIDWNEFSEDFEWYYTVEPMQYQNIGYHDFMMNLKDLWLEMQPTVVESTKLKDLLKDLKNNQSQRDFDSFDDDYDE